MKPFSAFDLDLILEKAGPSFKKLEEQRVLLTGGTGFFGQWITAAWAHAQQNYKLLPLTVLSRQDRAPSAAIEYLRGDIRSFKSNQKWDTVIHAATPASAELDRDKPDEMYSIIVEGAQNILKICQSSGVKKLLFTSSGAVYEGQSAYARGKREAEEILCQFESTVIARCFAFVGPGLPLDQHFAIGNFIRDALRKREIHVRGDGSPVRSYLYTADLVIWLLRILTEAPKGSTYDVGSDIKITIGELAKMISAKAGVKVQVEATPINSDGRDLYLPHIQKAKEELGLRVYTSLEQSILKTMEYYAS